MSREDEKQLSLDLGSPAAKEREHPEEGPSGSKATRAEVRSLNEIRASREKEESAKHFREIIKRARHF